MRKFDRQKKWILICENQQLNHQQESVRFILENEFNFLIIRLEMKKMQNSGRRNWKKNLIPVTCI
jgi:hypothetical protein